jgi:hypothetical protein
MIRALRHRISKLTPNETRDTEYSAISDEGWLSRNESSSSVTSTETSNTAITPPPAYRSQSSSLCSSDNHSEVSASEETFAPAPSFNASSEAACGIRWKYANQGLNQISLSAQESRVTKPGSVTSDHSLTRQLYVHGALYTLRGLPSDLSSEEVVCIWSACPDQVRQVALIEARKQLELQTTPTVQRRRSNIDAMNQPSILHRVLAVAILQVFLLFQFLLPYFKALMAEAFSFERKHKMSEKLLKSGAQTLDAVMKFGDSVCKMNDGKVGNALQDFMVWWITGIAGGIQDGIGSGLAVMGMEINKQGRIEPLNG